MSSAPDGAELAGLLRGLAAAERALADAVARRLGLGLTDFLALVQVLSSSEVGPVELGRRLGLGSGASTALVDRLESAGHLQRQPHPQDRRRIVLVPSAHARQQLAEQLGPLADRLTEVAASFTAQERVTIAAFLRAAIDTYGPRAGPADP